MVDIPVIFIGNGLLFTGKSYHGAVAKINDSFVGRGILDAPLYG